LEPLNWVLIRLKDLLGPVTRVKKNAHSPPAWGTAWGGRWAAGWLSQAPSGPASEAP